MNVSKVKLRKKVLLAVTALVLSLLAGEIFLRVAAPHVRGSHQRPSAVWREDFLREDRLGKYHPTLGWVLKPDSTTTNQGWEFKHTIKTNSKGLRDDEVAYDRMPGVRRCLLLGDSFAMGDGVERGVMFADVLEQRGAQATSRITEVASGRSARSTKRM